MRVQHWWNVTLTRKRKYSEESQSQCHSVHHNSIPTALESNTGLRGEGLLTNWSQITSKGETFRDGYTSYLVILRFVKFRLIIIDCTYVLW
jgi:hypothetical protein